MPTSLILSGGGAYNSPPTKPGFGLNFGTISSIASYAPVVGGIVSNLGSVAGAIGIDTKTPAQHIAERTANGELLKSAAISGSNLAWEKLWVASSRHLPVGYVDRVPRLVDKQFIGWARVGPQLEAMLRQVESARGALPTPTGASEKDLIQTLTANILAAGSMLTSSSGGTFGGGGLNFGGIGDSPQNHSGASSEKTPSSTNYVVVGAIVLAMLLITRKR